MKKFQFLALMGAAALTGATLFSCSNEELAEVNPNYNPETGEVLTSFVMNVSATNTPTTRMTSANTQAIPGTNGFRGIVDGALLSFKKDAPVADGKWIPSSTTEADKTYSLGSIFSTTDASTDGNTSHRIIELALPTETNTLMFYGKAPKSGVDADNAQGKITYTLGTKNLAGYSFALNRRVADENQADYRQYGDLIRAALDYITSAELNGADVVYNGNHYATTVKWTQYVTISDAGVIKPATKDPLHASLDMGAMGEILADALSTFATINAGEVRAGSGTSVARTIGDLKFIMNKISSATPTDEHEAVSKALAEQIISRIDACFQGTAPTLEWKTSDVVKGAISYTGATDKITRKGSTGSALTEWPDISFGVPKGCAQLLVETTKSTDVGGQVTTPGTISWKYSATTPLLSATSTSIYNVYYPAELCYFGNSPIRVTNDSHVEADYPQGVTNWDTDDQWAAGINNNNVAWTKNGHVVSTTRSVAMQYNINYGSALLKSTVGYASGVTVLQDNNHAIQLDKNPSLGASEEPNGTIDVTASTFKLTGILVGGQPATVGWDYLPVSGTTFDCNIYDKAITSDAIPATGTSEPNYTLVWDNWNATNKGAKQNDVYVALEFTNNSGKDFWGNCNIIRNGGTFYIIGKLDPDAGLSTTDRSAGITWPDAAKQALPPFDGSGNTIKERRVFIQDFMTTANFIIGANSLQSAYATVPDLRSAQISLGLSVDLKWQTGLTFDNVVLGQ
ncbi:MAG: hypothetical protein II750_00055 [Bacteroidaceae bacterium]|nr:hypothetical protein [Bacteroidaceae bacterium]